MHIFGFVVLLSHRLLAPVGVIADHDSLRGDQAIVCLFVTGTFSSCFVFVCFKLQDHSG